jgi:hypothetical protein
MSGLEEAFDGLVERFAADSYQTEVARARADFDERTGRVFEEDELYESRTVAFLEWYVVRWPLVGVGRPPVEAALGDPRGAGDETRAAWRAWARSHLSVFGVAELREGEVMLEDLVGGGLFIVDERRRLHGVSEGDVLTARLLGWRDKIRFGRTFTYHPAAAWKAIEGHAARMLGEGGKREDVVDHVESLRVRALRYKHVAPERLYEERARD